MINPIDTAGFLTDGKGGTKHSNGRLFRILTGSPYRIDKQYSVGLRTMIDRANCAYWRKRTQTIKVKSCSSPPMSRCSRFSATKNHRFRTCRPLCFPHLSSSSDLRILSSTQPSQVSPMTDFRQVWCLHAYSGGTVRDSHPVFYSPAGLLPRPQALKRNIYLCIYDT